MIFSVIQGSGIVLEQNYIYRARLAVVPPFGPAATESAVRDELGKQGFADIRFYEKDRLPADWPPTEKEDDSGFMGKMYYLEGRFTLSGRKIPISELGSKVALKGMWLYLVPKPASVPGAPPQPPSLPPIVSTPDPTVPPGSSGVADLTEHQKKIVIGWFAIAAAFVVTRRMLQARQRRR